MIKIKFNKHVIRTLVCFNLSQQWTFNPVFDQLKSCTSIALMIIAYLLNECLKYKTRDCKPFGGTSTESYNLWAPMNNLSAKRNGIRVIGRNRTLGS